MFEKLGRKLAKGAKAEILETPEGEFGWRNILEGLTAIVKIGVIVFAIINPDGKTQPAQPQTIIINNYISKGE